MAKTTMRTVGDSLNDTFTAASANSNLLVLNIPNATVAGAGGISSSNQPRGVDAAASFQQMSGPMPMLLVGDGQQGGGTVDQNSLSSFLRFEDSVLANLTQTNITKTVIASEQLKTSEKMVKCTECGRSFESSCHYFDHLGTHEGSRVLTCPNSWGSLRSIQDQQRQKRQRLNDNLIQLRNDRPHPCRVNGCLQMFSTRWDLDVHMRRSHTSKPFQCQKEGCGKSFSASYMLTRHMRAHTGLKAFKCSEEGCGKSFTTLHNLTRHVRSHVGLKPFQCPTEGCGKSFTTLHNQTTHTMTHIGLKPFRCPEAGCGKSFATLQHQTNHMRTHTGEKPFACTHEDCNIRFATMSSLKRHNLIHTGEKPFACTHQGCNLRFAIKSSLKRHIKRIHTGEKPYESEISSKQFTQCSPLNKLLKEHMQLSTPRYVKEVQSSQGSPTDSRIPDLTLHHSVHVTIKVEPEDEDDLDNVDQEDPAPSGSDSVTVKVKLEDEDGVGDVCQEDPTLFDSGSVTVKVEVEDEDDVGDVHQEDPAPSDNQVKVKVEVEEEHHTNDTLQGDQDNTAPSVLGGPKDDEKDDPREHCTQFHRHSCSTHGKGHAGESVYPCKFCNFCDKVFRSSSEPLSG